MQQIEIIGYIATVIITLQLIPQIIKSTKSKSTKDISIHWTLIYSLGLVFWIIYGIGIKSMPLIISSILELALALWMIGLKLRYG